MSLQNNNSELSVIVESENTDEKEIFSELQQECDRVFFLTSESLNPKFEWETNQNGTTSSQSSISCRINTVNAVPQNTTLQDWTSSLAIQLRLWGLAKSSGLPLTARINILFQIIEIFYPETNNPTYYPVYLDISKSPHPRTESLLLRNLVSHGGKDITSSQLKNYCQFLGIPENFHNPINSKCIKVLKNRINIVEKEAHKVINEKITLKEEF